MLNKEKLQEEIKNWWETNPMTYDWHKNNKYKEGTKEWFKEIDARFFDNCTSFFAQEKGQTPFSKLIPYDKIRDINVLEIGCGSGAHSRLIIESGAKFTAIDLSLKAIELTSKRLESQGYKANLIQMDAESMNFSNDSFDFVWSWGVIHHSSNIKKIISEIARIVKPGGEVRIMVYHRDSINFYIALLRGFLSGRLFIEGIEKTLNYYSDGFIANYYKKEEFAKLFKSDFNSVKTYIYGQKNELVPIPSYGELGRCKYFLANVIPDSIASWILNYVGGFIFLIARK